MEWQPIESAPNDGTLIQIRQGEWYPTHAYWKNGDWCHIEYQHTNKPTHWQPLPDPPAKG